MTNPVSEPIDKGRDDPWLDDELSDEALDQAAGRGGKMTGSGCTTCPACRDDRSS